ncbi:hypothetical protein CYMTET_35197 [Cymbomonas tetramitiformis]|uniref:Uncharacterized protein n=1 Tax=Cymbomonas tetramitiformis TaxID=36881 RepID=A0AAE0KP80_9CHLO|nr:hypothetical protein CYMTET_35197 [Cymbomonas tetramitiformis]
MSSTGGNLGPAAEAARWAVWSEDDAQELLRSFLPLGMVAEGPRAQLVLADWQGASFDALAGMVALAQQLQHVPQDRLLETRELVESGLLVERAGVAGHPTFEAAGEWKLAKSWSRGGKAEATMRLRFLHKWAQEMLDGPAVGVGGAPPLTEERVQQLLSASVAKAVQDALAAQLTAVPTPGGGMVLSTASQRVSFAPGTAGGLLSGPEGQYRAALAALQARREGWSRERPMDAVCTLVAEGARLRPVLVACTAEHDFKAPGRALEAEEFEALVWARPGLLVHGGGLDELPPAEEATVEDWHVYVQLALERVTEMQRVARGKGEEPYEDVMSDSFFRKRPRSNSPDPGGAAAAATALLAGAPPGIPQLTATRRAELVAQAAGMRTLPQDVLARALQSGDIPDTIGKPPRAPPC